MDKTAAAAALVVGSPALAARAAVAYATTGRVWDREAVLGRDGRPFVLRTFAGPQRGRRLAQLVNIAKGDLRFVGPRPLRATETPLLSDSDRWRLQAQPGVFSASRLQSSTGIAYEGEAADRTHLQDQSLRSRRNLGLIARSVLAETITRNGDQRVAPDHFDMLGVRIANVTMAETLDWIMTRASTPAASPRSGGRSALVCFVNPAALNIAVSTPAYRSVLHRADLVLPDGIGLKVASRITRVAIRENVNGTDLFPRLCARTAETGVGMYLLGARPGVAEAVAERMRQTHPDLRIVGCHHGYFERAEEDRLVADINASGAQILLVAMGVPDQEHWLLRLRDRLRPSVLLGVGGLFDFYSGRIPRAPMWMRELGLEWVWRLAKEPRRMWRRYVVGNPVFLYRVWRDERAALHAGPAHTSPVVEALNAQAVQAARAARASLASVASLDGASAQAGRGDAPMSYDDAARSRPA